MKLFNELRDAPSNTCISFSEGLSVPQKALNLEGACGRDMDNEVRGVSGFVFDGRDIAGVGSDWDARLSPSQRASCCQLL